MCYLGETIRGGCPIRVAESGPDLEAKASKTGGMSTPAREAASRVEPEGGERRPGAVRSEARTGVGFAAVGEAAVETRRDSALQRRFLRWSGRAPRRGTERVAGLLALRLVVPVGLLGCPAAVKPRTSKAGCPWRILVDEAGHESEARLEKQFLLAYGTTVRALSLRPPRPSTGQDLRYHHAQYGHC